MRGHKRHLVETRVGANVYGDSQPVGVFPRITEYLTVAITKAI